MLNLIKKHATWLIMIIFTIYYFLYIQATTVNVIWQAWFFQIPAIEKFLNGTLVLHDLVNNFGEHGMLGYNLIILVNVAIFKLNTFFDAYLILTLIVLSTIILYLAFRKSIINLNCNDLKFNSLILFVISFLMFSVSQQIGGGMDTQVRLGIFTFMWTTYLIDILFFEYKTNYFIALTIIMIFISLDIFGTAYSFAWIPSLLFIGFINYFVMRRKINFKIFLLILVSLFSATSIYFNMYLLKGVGNTNHIGIFSGIISALFHPLTSVKFVLAFLSSSTLGRTIWEDHYIINPNWIILNGTTVLIIYLYTLKHYISSKMWKITYFPVFLMTYTFGVIILVLLGREVNLGWDGGTNYWYAVHVKFGLVGVVWVLYYRIQTLSDNRKIREFYKNRTVAISCLLILYIVFAQLFSNAVDWRRAPHVKKYFEVMVPYALSPESMPVDSGGYTPLIADIEGTLNGIRVLEKYRLNVYYDLDKRLSFLKSGPIIENGKLVTGSLGLGWYGEDGGVRWMAKDAEVAVKSGDKGKIIIEGYEPQFLVPNKLRIFINGELLLEETIPSGTFIFEKDVTRNSVIKLRLEVDRTIVPQKEGLNNDERDLGLLIKNLSTK